MYSLMNDAMKDMERHTTTSINFRQGGSRQSNVQIGKNRLFVWRAYQWPSLWKYFSLLFLPATPSSLSRTPEEPSTRALLPKLQRIKDTVSCAELGAEVQGHHQEHKTQILIVRLLKKKFNSFRCSKNWRVLGPPYSPPDFGDPKVALNNIYLPRVFHGAAIRAFIISR